MGCFVHSAATGAEPQWGLSARGLSALQRVPQGLAVSGPALHETFNWSMALQPRSGGPLPPLERGHPARPGGPSAGTPPGPGSPSSPPHRGLCPTGLSQRPTAPGAAGRGVGRRGGGVRRPLGGCHPRRHHPVPLPGQRAPRHAPRPVCRGRRGAGLDPQRICRVVCGVACTGGARYPRSTSTPARGTMPPRERDSQSGSSCGRFCSAAGCRSSFTPPDLGVRALEGHPPRPPCPSPPVPPLAPPAPAHPPPSRMRVSPYPPPLLIQPAAQACRPRPADADGCALHAWLANMQSHQDSH